MSNGLRYMLCPANIYMQHNNIMSSFVSFAFVDVFILVSYDSGKC